MMMMMIKCVRWSSFRQDKSADYSTTTGVGVRNMLYALLVLGTYEALIEYNVMKTEHRWADNHIIFFDR